jgi:ACT domain
MLETVGGQGAGMSRYRLRVELPDLPGALAKVATIISDLDGDVVSIDIHELDGHQVVDELVVEVLTELDRRVLAAALEESDAGILLSCVPAAARPEPVVEALGWARELAAANDSATLGRVLAAACHSSKVWVAPIDDAREVPAGRLALARGAPLVQRSHDLPEPLGGRPASTMWLLAVPDGQPQSRCIAFLARPGSLRYTASEVARVETLMALHRTLIDGSARREHPAST